MNGNGIEQCIGCEINFRAHELTAGRCDHCRGIYRVPEQNFSTLLACIAKLNKRAAKLGCPEITVTPIGNIDTEYHWRHPQGRRPYLIIVKVFTLAGVRPKLNGWEFVATIQHDSETGLNTLATLPGITEPLPLEYRKSEPKCDHCGLDRRRNDTYIVRHDDGTYKQVGRSCLKDFTGHKDPHSAARMAEYLLEAIGYCSDAEDEGWGMGGGRVDPFWELGDVVEIALAVIRECGWVSATEAKNSFDHKAATKALVFDVLCPPKGEEAQKWSDKIYDSITDADTKTAAEAIAWVRSLPEEELVKSDYLWNLFALVEKGTTNLKKMGLAVSIPRAFNSELARREERKHAAVSEWFGEPGVRTIYTLTVLATRTLGGNYGATTLVTFADAAGNRAKTFSSGIDQDQWEIGKTYTVKATVKGHDKWQDVKQTVLTRVSFASAADVAKEPKKAARIAKAAPSDSR